MKPKTALNLAGSSPSKVINVFLQLFFEGSILGACPESPHPGF